MLNNTKPRFILAMLLSGIMLLMAASTDKEDPFQSYRDFTRGPLNIEAKKLNHFDEEAALIRQKLKLNLSKKERTILAGLHWALNLADDDKKFKFLFSDFLLLMHAMSHSHGRMHQAEVVDAILKKALARGYSSLSEYYPNDEEGGWRFSGIFPVLADYPAWQKRYFAFYEKQWPRLSESKAPGVNEFSESMTKRNYKEIFNFLVFSSFPHWYLQKVKKPPVVLPEGNFPLYIKAFEQFTYKNHEIADPDFRNLGYLATHIPLVLTNYGEFRLEDSINARKAGAYIKASFEKARELGDFDLYAEYIQCLKMYNKGLANKAYDNFLYGLQRPDGSWGSKRDFTTNAYTAIHPTGAALMALNQP